MYENITYFSGYLFHEVSEGAFDQIWDLGLLICTILPHTDSLILTSYLSNRFFWNGHGERNSSGKHSCALFTSGLPNHPHTTIFTFTDHPANLFPHHSDPIPVGFASSTKTSKFRITLHLKFVVSQQKCSKCEMET